MSKSSSPESVDDVSLYLQGQIKISDAMKFIHQLALTRENSLDYLGEHTIITQILKSGKRREEKSQTEMQSQKSGQRNATLLALKTG